MVKAKRSKGGVSIKGELHRFEMEQSNVKLYCINFLFQVVEIYYTTKRHKFVNITINQ